MKFRNKFSKNSHFLFSSFLSSLIFGKQGKLRANRGVIFLLLFFFLGFYSHASASSIFDGIETQINPDSSPQKIEKLQRLLQDLGLYNGEINGNHDDVKGVLVQYQLKKGLIQDESDWGAGYFGRKTIVALKEDFGDEFEVKAQVHLEQEEVEKGKTSFIITAYYSPLPGQKKYITGSYRGDIRLNGSGKVTASGKGVFPGLIAAPRNYDFGTKIYFEDIGIGVVEDRGGAIVNAGDRGHHSDRIDIRMGYGDEGLTRAIKRGQRTVKGEILEDFFDYNIAFDESVLAAYYPIKLSPVTSSREQISSMQSLFQELGYHSGPIDGLYQSIKETVIDFQIENGIISSRGADDAGYIGPKTSAFLQKKYPAGIFKPQSQYSFSVSQKKKLDDIISILKKSIDERSIGSTRKKKNYTDNIIERIEKMIATLQNKKTKLRLQYIKDNL